MARKRGVISGEPWWPSPWTEGDFSSPEPTPIPRSSGGPQQPMPTSTPDFHENDRGVFRNDPSITIFPSGPDYAGSRGDDFYSGNFGANRPHSAMDYTDPVPNRPHAGMDFTDTPESFPATGTPRLEPSFLFSGPTVETPTGTSRGGNLDNEPSLFPSPDDWWNQNTPTTETGGSTGGSMWEGEDALGGFVGDTTLGSDLSADLGGLGFGENYPVTPETVSPEPGDIPVEPTPLPQPPEDSTWTTSPDDRRFLPEPSGEPTVETSSRPSMGADLRNPTLGRFNPVDPNLSLGAFFGTSLPALRYGTDRYVQGGRVAVGDSYNDTGGTFEGGTTPNSNFGVFRSQAEMDSYWNTHSNLDDLDSWRETHSNQSVQNDGTGTTIIPLESRERDAINLNVDAFLPAPSGLMSPRAYDRATFGGVRSTGYRDPRGSNIGNSPENVRNANLMLMASQAFGGSPNDPGITSDEGVSRRYGWAGRLNEFGEYEQTGEMGGGQGWTGAMSPFIYGSARSGVRGIPGGRGG